MHIFGHRIMPNGPDLIRPLHYDVNLSGTKVSFDVPENSGAADRGVMAAKYEPVKSYNIYGTTYHKLNKDDGYETESKSILTKGWDFYGLPIIHRDAFGVCEFRVAVLHMPEFGSLFRPRRFECAIERYIYASRFNKSKQPKCTRLNWNLKNISNNVWVNYDYCDSGDLSQFKGKLGSVWHLAISEKHILTVFFDVYVLSKPQLVKEYLDEIVETVMSTFKVQLSEDALNERERAKSGHSHESLSQTLPPYDYEQMDWYDRQNMLRKVAEGLEDSYSMPDDEFYKLVDDAQAEQDIRYQEMRARIMSTHMRFEELEAEDLKVHKNALNQS